MFTLRQVTSSSGLVSGGAKHITDPAAAVLTTDNIAAPGFTTLMLCFLVANVPLFPTDLGNCHPCSGKSCRLS